MQLVALTHDTLELAAAAGFAGLTRSGSAPRAAFHRSCDEGHTWEPPTRVEAGEAVVGSVHRMVRTPEGFDAIVEVPAQDEPETALWTAVPRALTGMRDCGSPSEGAAVSP